MRRGFRMWDEVSQRYADINNTIDCLAQQLRYDAGKDPKSGVYYNHEKHGVVFERSMGLKDIGNVEIFEGDIVRGVADNGFKRISFVGIVVWDDEDAGFCFEADGNWPHIKPWFAKDIEVIGTIHENPGLLEVK